MTEASDSPCEVFRLPRLSVLAADGPDSGSFLQAMLTADLRSLPEGGWCWAASCQRDGRVLAFLALHRSAADCHRLVLPGEGTALLVEHLQRHRLRQRLTVQDAGLQVIGGFGQPPEESDFTFDERWLGLRPMGQEVEAADARWAVADIRARLPWLPAAQVGKHLPQALGLDRLGAVSLKKGCYPGQEIIARAHFRGQVKRELQALFAPGARDVVSVHRAGQEQALIAAAVSDGTAHALAVVTPGEGPLLLRDAQGCDWPARPGDA